MTKKYVICILGILLGLGIGMVTAQDETPEATPSESTAEATMEATAEATASPRFEVAGTYTVRQPVGDGDLRRQYTVHIPPKYFEAKQPVPLLLILHGAGGSGQGMESFTGFDRLADKEGFIVAYPDAINYSWNDNRGDQMKDVDDIGYLAHVIDSVADKANVDRTRVYAAGYSRGGMMAYRLGCVLADQFAAVASVASTFPIYLMPECQNTPPKGLMVIQGTDDPVIPWIGIDTAFFSAADTLTYWVKHNDCAHTGPIKDSADLNPLDGTRLLTQEGVKCKQPLMLYGVFHGGHTWPGHPVDMGGFDAGLTSMDFDASATIWEFFKMQALPS